MCVEDEKEQQPQSELSNQQGEAHQHDACVQALSASKVQQHVDWNVHGTTDSSHPAQTEL